MSSALICLICAQLHGQSRCIIVWYAGNVFVTGGWGGQLMLDLRWVI